MGLRAGLGEDGLLPSPPPQVNKAPKPGPHTVKDGRTGARTELHVTPKSTQEEWGEVRVLSEFWKPAWAWHSKGEARPRLRPGPVGGCQHERAEGARVAQEGRARPPSLL